jgi:hypothetical protein
MASAPSPIPERADFRIPLSYCLEPRVLIAWR